LNGAKIAGPTVLARIPHDELEMLFRGYGWAPLFVEGDDPSQMHQKMAATVAEAIDEIHRIQQEARRRRLRERPRWPMIVLRSPKGWTGRAGDRRQTHRGNLPSASGAHGRHVEARAREDPRALDEKLPTTRSSSTSAGGCERRSRTSRRAAHGG